MGSTKFRVASPYCDTAHEQPRAWAIAYQVGFSVALAAEHGVLVILVFSVHPKSEHPFLIGGAYTVYICSVSIMTSHP